MNVFKSGKTRLITDIVYYVNSERAFQQRQHPEIFVLTMEMKYDMPTIVWSLSIRNFILSKIHFDLDEKFMSLLNFYKM